MLPEIIVCSKPLSSRLEEYQDLLDDVDAPCSEVNDVWSTIFEGLAIIKVGWQGVWVLSQKNCKKYNVLYPTVVIVKVNDFNSENLTVTVTVEGVQDDILLPTVLEVLITELYPIGKQDYDALDLKVIADWFDKCRYFFKYLWYPWDAKEDVKMRDWCETHLKNRLQLQYDAKSGVLDEFARNYLKSLLNEAEEINEALLDMTMVNNNEQELQLVRYYLRRKMIKSELELFEEPELRHGLIGIKQREKDLEDPPRKSSKGEARLVWTGGATDEFLKYTQVARNLINSDTTIKISHSLQNAFDRARQEDIILVNEGEHFITSIGNHIKYGGSVRGVYSSGAVIKPDPLKLKRTILFDSYGFLTFENLTIVRGEGICFQICQNTLKISNCKIYGENSSVAKGIVVSTNCNLEVDNCEFKGFATAIILQKGANAKITDTRIHDCVEGIRVADEAKLSLTKVEISSCDNYGLRMESSKFESATALKGNADILKSSEDIKLESVLLTANRKSNVFLTKIKNECLIESEDEMDESCNNTIYLTDEDSDDFEDSVDITEKISNDVNVVESGDHGDKV